MRTRVLDTAELRRLAVEVEADPRTVAKLLAGKRVRGVVGRRLGRRLLELGYSPALDETATTTAGKSK